jgi:hypothetical protein
MEAAWSYQHRLGVGAGSVTPSVVSTRFRQLAAHKNVRSVEAAAIARELAGFRSVDVERFVTLPLALVAG